MRGAARRLTPVAVASGVALAAVDVVRRSHPGGAVRWRRRNYRDHEVDLAAGPATWAGLVAGMLVARSPAAAAVAATAGGLGLYDDLGGHTHARGLRGHAAALRHGVVTTGAVKLAGLVAVALAAGPSRPRRAGPVFVDVALVAGTANLVNLLDLRPGRALKVALLAGAPLAVATGRPGDVAGAVVGVTAVMLPGDLAERHMLGDCGANALGGALGWAMADRLGPRSRLLAAGVVVGLTALSERVSFTAAIARRPWLDALDRWGRRAS